MNTGYYHSPIGWLRIEANESAIQAVSFMNNDPTEVSDESPVIKNCIQQLKEYFNGDRREFDFVMQQEGTVFQQKVWNELSRIPFGKTISYLQLAEKLGDVKSIRAAGSANGKNQLAIVVPCHRVIGANGKLVGYAGELWRKDWLLKHEAKFALGVQQLF
jgi:methylated-DNA-[protein]-cysteine S-methyltransferase